MDAVIENLPTYFEGFRMTAPAARRRGPRALVIGTIIAAMRISPVASLCVRDGLHRGRAEHPADARAHLLRVRAARTSARARSSSWRSSASAVYTSPFVAEALRSGINGVPVGQARPRAARPRFRADGRLVVLPQAFRMTIPPLINVFIALTKNTSVAGGFFVVELFAIGKRRSRTPTATRSSRSSSASRPSTSLITVPLGLLAAARARWVVQR